MTLGPGTSIAHYRIVRHLAEGGMGVVFEGLDVRLDRRVAIKVLRPELAADAEARARFEREARNASRVAHEHVVDVYDFGFHEGAPYLVMEYLDGESLFDRMRRGPMELDEVVRVVVPICLGLARAHALGIVHRDLKPENVVLAQLEGQPGPTPKLVDFGVAFLARSTEARLTGRDLVVGTLAYLAPEQLDADYAPDPRADQYALAVTTYECLAGRSPIAQGTPREILARKAQGRHTALRTHRPDLPEALERVVARAMATEPSERYSDVRVFACALLDHASETTRARWGELVGYRRTTFVERVDVEVPGARADHEPQASSPDERRGGRARLAGVVLGVAVVGALAWGVAIPRAPVTSADGGSSLDAAPRVERDASVVVVAAPSDAGLSAARDGSSIVDEDAAPSVSDVGATPRRRDAGATGVAGDGARGSGVGLGSAGKAADDIGTFGRSGVGAGGGEAPKSATGVVRSGEIELDRTESPGLSKEEIRRLMATNTPRVRRCYEDRLRALPTLEARVKVRVTVGPSGAVVAVDEDGPTVDATLSNCVLAAVRRLTFPRPRDGMVMHFVWPFVFRPAP